LPFASRLVLAAAALATACAAARPRAPAEPQRQVRSFSAPAVAHYLRARLAMSQDDGATAVEELRLALAHDEESPHLHVAFAEALARNGDRERAEGEARRALELARGGPVEPRARLVLAQALATGDRLDAAAAELALATRAEGERARAAGRPVNPEPWRLLARVDLMRGDEPGATRALEALAEVDPAAAALGYREAAHRHLDRPELRDAAKAERYLRRAIEHTPTDVESLKLLASVLEVGRRAEARAALERAAAADPDDLETSLTLGRLALADGDVSGARAWLAQVLAADPDEVGARVRVASTWLEARRPNEALAALGTSERDGRVLYLRGMALQRLRRFGDAAASFRGVPAEDADLFTNARVSLAWCLSMTGKHDEAVRALDRSLALRPGDVRVVTTAALVLQRGGRATEAVEVVRRALAEGDHDGPLGAELYDALASSLEKAGRRAEALAELNAAVAAHPKDANLVYTLGNAYDRAGERDAALAQMWLAVKADPKHAAALNFLAYSFAERGERLEEAEALIGRALALDPDNGSYLDSLGWILFRRGHASRAVDALERANALSGPDATILEHLGDAYRATQRPADAASAYRRALKSFDPTLDATAAAAQRASLEKKLRDMSPRSALRPR
jgi:tetratricopeptide (TPR) repeat protein